MYSIIGIIILVLYAFLVFYIGWSGWRWMRPGPARWFKVLYIVTITIVSGSFILGRMVDGFSLLTIIGAYWMAVFYLLVILLPIVHLTVWLSRLTPLPRHLVEKWSGYITLVLLVAAIGYGSFNAYSPVVRTYHVHIDKPAPAFSSLNIVMASDMHFGLLSGRRHAERLVHQVNALKPDLVLFPGDIIDDVSQPYLDQEIDRLLAQIEATYGVYASLGNHDKNDGEIRELIDILQKSNIRVLYDEAATVEDSLTLIGRKDHSDRSRVELSELAAQADLTKPVIMLDHQPYDLDIAALNGVDLMVSGHTHRGQIAPAHLITRRLFENDWGHLQKGSFHSIVSSGFGFWGPPIRIGSRSEMVQIHVTFAAD